MDWLSIGIHTLGMLGGVGDWSEDALNLIARMPRLLGLIFRYREVEPKIFQMMTYLSSCWQIYQYFGH